MVESPSEDLVKITNRKVEREHPLGGVTRKAKGKGFGIACQSVVRVRRGFKILPNNVIAQVVGWENPDPTTKW
jgi:hypothetical protein